MRGASAYRWPMATRSKKATPKKTRFVPQVVFASVVVGAGVVPLCVTACSSSSPAAVTDSGTAPGVARAAFDGGDSGQPLTVAMAAFDSGMVDTGMLPGVAMVGFDSSVMDAPLTVAMTGFDASDGSTEAGDAHEEG